MGSLSEWRACQLSEDVCLVLRIKYELAVLFCSGKLTKHDNWCSMLSQNKILTSDGQKRGENGAAGCVCCPLHWHLLYVWETSKAWKEKEKEQEGNFLCYRHVSEDLIIASPPKEMGGSFLLARNV